MVQIRFWWPGYHPEHALTSFDPVVLETPFEGTANGGRTWRPPKPGTTLRTVHDWLVDHECEVINVDLVRERRHSRWEGLYVLTIGNKRR